MKCLLSPQREVRCVCEEMVRLLSGGDSTGREGQRVRQQVWSKLEVHELNSMLLYM